MKKLSKIWEFIVDEGIATDEELQLVTDIMGYNEDVLNSVIYARTAYHDMQQYLECE